MHIIVPHLSLDNRFYRREIKCIKDFSGRTEMAKPKAVSGKKRGRPPLPPEQRRRNNITIRLRDDLKSEMQEAGASQGRSLSEEIESRLELSRIDLDVRLQGFGSEGRSRLFRALVLAVEVVESTTGKDIFTDPDTASAAYEAAHPWAGRQPAKFP